MRRLVLYMIILLNFQLMSLFAKEPDIKLNVFHTEYDGSRKRHNFHEDVILFTQGNDTLNFFCEINERWIPENKDIGFIPVSLRVRYDYVFEQIKKADGTIVVAHEDFGNTHYRLICYEKQMELLDQTMDYVKSINDSIELTQLDIYVPYLGDGVYEMTEEYLKANGKRHPEEILQKSCLLRDISKIAQLHGLSTGNVWIADNIYDLIDNDIPTPVCNEDRNSKIPRKVLMYYALINLIKGD